MHMQVSPGGITWLIGRCCDCCCWFSCCGKNDLTFLVVFHIRWWGYILQNSNGTNYKKILATFIIHWLWIPVIFKQFSWECSQIQWFPFVTRWFFVYIKIKLTIAYLKKVKNCFCIYYFKNVIKFCYNFLWFYLVLVSTINIIFTELLYI